MSKASALSARVLEHLERRGTEATRRWSTAYLKNSTPFFGCKMPAVRECVRIAVEEEEEKKPNKKRARLEDSETAGMTTSYMSDAIALLQHEYGESKQAGSILLCEHTPPHVLGSVATLERLEREVMRAENVLTDWAVTDSFAIKVLTRVWKANPQLATRILAYAHEDTSSLWHRRCGIVAFVGVFKPNVDASALPANFGLALVDACVANLLASPEERFAQTGTAWVLRYALAAHEFEGVRERAIDAVMEHKSLWTTEAKKSLVEQLKSRDDAKLKAEILALK